MDLYLEHNPFDGTQLCAQVDPELFFSDEEGVYAHLAQAKAICKSCPLVTPCLEYALSHTDLDGVWGATTLKERSLMRRRRAYRGVRSPR